MAPSGSARTGSIRLRMALPPPFIKFLLLGTASTLFDLADGCLRQSSSSSSSSSNHNNDQHQHSPGMTDGTTPLANHRLPCHESEARIAACLNGGECFASRGYEDQRHLSCHCPAEFTGERCQEYYIDPEILKIQEHNIRTAHVTAAVSVCVLVFFIVMLMIYVYIKYRRKSQIPAESMRGPRLEIAEYSSYNTKVRRLSSKKNGGCSPDAALCAKQPLYTAPPAVTPAHAQTELPQSNGKEDLNTSQTPLLNETPKKNGDLIRPTISNPLAASPSLMRDNDPNDSYNPDDIEDIRFIDETTLPRPSKSKPRNNNPESQL